MLVVSLVLASREPLPPQRPCDFATAKVSRGVIFSTHMLASFLFRSFYEAGAERER